MGKAATRVRLPHFVGDVAQLYAVESCSLGMEYKFGGRLHLMLSIGSIPIAHKYHEGNVKSTLKRGLKVPEPVGAKAKDGHFTGQIAAWLWRLHLLVIHELL